MLAWADTEPGVLAVTLVDLAVVYQDAGRTKTTRVPLRVTFRTGVLAYWDCAFADPGDGKWSAALAAKREFARASDAEYRVMTWRFFADHRLELQGRLALQNVLYSGRAVDTSAEEASVLLHVGRAPHTVEALAATLGYTDPVAMLVVARLWRAGMVVLPLAAAGLNMQWQVSRRVRYGR
jgi:hypothetical protein